MKSSHFFLLLIVFIINGSNQLEQYEASFYQATQFDDELKAKEFKMELHKNLLVQYYPYFNVYEIDIKRNQNKQNTSDFCSANQRKVAPQQMTSLNMVQQFENNYPSTSDLLVINNNLYQLDKDLDIYIFDIVFQGQKETNYNPKINFKNVIKLQDEGASKKIHQSPKFLYIENQNAIVVLGDDVTFSIDLNQDYKTTKYKDIPANKEYKKIISLDNIIFIAYQSTLYIYTLNMNEQTQINNVRTGFNLHYFDNVLKNNTNIQFADMIFLQKQLPNLKLDETEKNFVNTNQLLILDQSGQLFLYPFDKNQIQLGSPILRIQFPNTSPQHIAYRKMNNKGEDALIYITGKMNNYTQFDTSMYFAYELIEVPIKQSAQFKINRAIYQESEIKEIFLTNHYAVFIGNNTHQIVYHSINQNFVQNQKFIIDSFPLIGLRKVIIFSYKLEPSLNQDNMPKLIDDDESNQFIDDENHFLIGAQTFNLGLFELVERKASIYCSKQDNASTSEVQDYEVIIKTSECSKKLNNYPFDQCLIKQQIKVGLEGNFIHSISSKSNLVKILLITIIILSLLGCGGIACFCIKSRSRMSEMKEEINQLKNINFQQLTNLDENIGKKSKYQNESMQGDVSKVPIELKEHINI